MTTKIQVTLAEAKELIIDCIKVKKTVLLTSSPGMGKSALIHTIAEEYNLELLDERMSTYQPVDINGLPYFNEDRSKAKFIPMENFPLAGDPIPEGKDGWLLFLDEFTSAPKSVMVALYKLLHDRKVGNTRLHKNVIIVLAGNSIADKAIANNIGTALQSRIIHLNIKTCLKGWLTHAYENHFDHRVLAFVNYKPNLLNNFNPNHEDQTFSCERTWHYMSDFLKIWGEDVPYSKLPLCTGTLGVGVGRELFAFCKVYKELPDIDNILAHPATATIPKEPMNQWAIAGSIAHRMGGDNVEKLMDYLIRMPIQFQVMAMKISVRHHPTMLSKPSVAAWVSKISKEVD